LSWRSPPIEGESYSVPADYGLPAHRDEGIWVGKNPKGLIQQVESRCWMASFEHDDLLLEDEVFEQ
jgi:hypothetical protein